MVLLSLASVTPRRLLELAVDRPTATACLEAVRAGEAGSQNDCKLARSLRPEAILRQMEDAGCRLVTTGDTDYPPSLLDLFDPPAGLFVRGRPLAAGRRVAMVGARNCSPAGADMARSLARTLARADVCVVSGGARGIDAAAHRGALAADGRTVAVLGCGVDVAYPRDHAELFAAIARTGTLVTEYPPGTRAEPFRFPARNRIVAGLSEAVLVVEGAAGSGSKITAEHALDTGRDVFAVPGAPWNELAEAPLELIRDGAGVIRGPADLIADLHLAVPMGLEESFTPNDPASGEGARDSAPLGLGPREAAVWRALAEPGPADRVASNSGLPLPEALAGLAALEVRGLALQAGGRYQRRMLPTSTAGGTRSR
jgi:DNA processing protein